jgi:hypothetical protein
MGEETRLVTELDDTAREALAELEHYLDGRAPDEVATLVLPLASRWVLNDAGLDVARLRGEAELLIRATPLSDKILTGFPGHVAYWVAQRMMIDEHEVDRPAVAADQLRTARAALARRAELVRDAGFPLVAVGFEEVLARSDGRPPDDVLWMAMAHRIGESVLDV